MAAPKKVDYDRIEPDWRAGIKSPPQMAAEYTEATGVAVSHTAIIKHFKSRGIPRDLKAKVQAKADAMVLDAMVSGKVSTETKTSDTEKINIAATQSATVQIAHRRDITRMRNLVLRLLDECEAEASDPGLFRDIGVIMRSPDDKGQDKLNDAYQKIISLPQRIKGVKELAETLKVLIGLEREAYGISQIPEPQGSNDAIDPVEGARRLAFALARAGHILNTGGKLNA
jgi:hypothetical protein